MAKSDSDPLMSLFLRAAFLPREEREAFCQEACAGNPGLEADLRSLLEVRDGSLGSFLEEPLVGNPLGADEIPYDAESILLPRDVSRKTRSGADGDALEGGLEERLGQRGYRIEGELSRGGMGVVLRGRDLGFDRPVAVKVLRRELRDEAQLLERFIGEAYINGRLQHPGIVPIYDIGVRSDDLPYFAMKLVEGRTLAQAIDDGTERLELLSVLEQVCQAVSYAHSHGIVHRDLKPSNVMIGAFGEVHVLDWGIAKRLGEEERVPPKRRDEEKWQREHWASESGSILGTLPYMPPEQARGDSERIDRRTDVFALGAILCELLTGEPPYRGTYTEVFRSAREADLQPAFQRLENHSGDPELVELARHCLCADPSDRPEDAGVVARRLQEHRVRLEERRRRAEVEAAEARVKVVEERRRRRLVTALTLVVSFVGVSFFALMIWWEQERRLRESAVVASLEEALDEAERALAAGEPAQAILHLEQAKRWVVDEDAPDELPGRSLVRLGDLERVASDDLARSRRATENARSIERLESLRLPEPLAIGGYRTDTTEDWKRLDREYEEVFAELGIRPVAEPFETVLERLAERGIDERLVGFLDDWASVWRRAGRAEDVRVLVELGDRLAADETRAEVQAAIGEGDVDRLLALAERLDQEVVPASTLGLVAHGLHHAERPDACARVLRAAVREHPTDFALRMRLARALVFQGGTQQAREAVEHYTAARTLRPENVETAHELARTLHVFLNENERAEEILVEITKARPEDAHLLYHLGYVQGRMGRHEEAIETLQRVIELHPEDSGSYNSIGVAHHALGRSREAVLAYEKAIEFEPDYFAAHLNLALALPFLGEGERAIEVCHRCIELDPRDAGPHDLLGWIAAQQERWPEAVRHLRRAIQLDRSSPKTWTNLGYALSWVGDVKGALEAYDEALWIDARFTKAHYNLALLAMNTNRRDDAVGHLEDCIRSDPNYMDGYNAMIGGFWDTNWAVVARGAALGRKHHPHDPRFRSWLGQALRSLGIPEVLRAMGEHVVAVGRNVRLR